MECYTNSVNQVRIHDITNPELLQNTKTMSGAYMLVQHKLRLPLVAMLASVWTCHDYCLAKLSSLQQVFSVQTYPDLFFVSYRLWCMRCQNCCP